MDKLRRQTLRTVEQVTQQIYVTRGPELEKLQTLFQQKVTECVGNSQDMSVFQECLKKFGAIKPVMQAEISQDRFNKCMGKSYAEWRESGIERRYVDQSLKCIKKFRDMSVEEIRAEIDYKMETFVQTAAQSINNKSQ